MSPPRILVTNDDGIQSEHLHELAQSMSMLGEVTVFAPERQQSAVGHGISLHKPLRVTMVRDGWYMVSGTPADCVMLAVRELMGGRPDLVASGINPGANLGDDITYSGTVAGAYEGMMLGVPSFSISNVSSKPAHAATAAAFAYKLARHVLDHGLPPDTTLNVNVPDVPSEQIAGLSVTRMGKRNYKDEIIERSDPRGVAYYWIGGTDPSYVAEKGTDFAAVELNRISITPLHRDVTNHRAIGCLDELDGLS